MSAYWKDLLREIRFSISRFLSLVLITALGVLVVVGIQATAIDMRAIADQTFREQQLYDIEVTRFPVPFTEDDVETIQGLTGVGIVEGVRFQDLLVDVSDSPAAVRAWQVPGELNRPTLVTGRMPERADECTVEPWLLSAVGGELGTQLRGIDDEFFWPEGGLEYCTIVGSARSPLYITGQRGISMFGRGLDYYLFMHPSAWEATHTVVPPVGLPGIELPAGGLPEGLPLDGLPLGELPEGLPLDRLPLDGLPLGELPEGSLPDGLPPGLDLADLETSGLPPLAFAQSGTLYNTIFVTMADSADMHQLSDEYFDAADNWRAEIEGIAPTDGEPWEEWTVRTRQEGLAFDSYYQDTRRLERVGFVFPIVFFAVAALVSLTTMSRMVDDQRTQIGIYKALGYHPFSVIMKFLLYALLASLLGATLGVLLGTYLLPEIIADAYGHLYTMPPIQPQIPWGVSLIATGSAIGLVLAVTLFTGLRATSGAPALLMRPRPPAKGRRVLLERIGPLWRRMGFFSKVTARNIFRYKRRVFMTLAGVAGCAALLLTAFGLWDSIGGIAELQFVHIIRYEVRAYFNVPIVAGEDDARDLLNRLPGDVLLAGEQSVTAVGPIAELDSTMIIPAMPDLLPTGVASAHPVADYFGLFDPESGVELGFTDTSVFLTDKLAETIGVSLGGQVEIQRFDGETASLEVTGIVENYVGHFIYLGAAAYQDSFAEPLEFNAVLIRTDDTPMVIDELEAEEAVNVILDISDHRASVADSTDALGVVTIVLVILACALALVVLFNLTNINILERTRELATLKVLGFSPRELAMYVYRENFLMIAAGIGLGLAAGVYLHRFVLGTVELDVLRFPLLIRPLSYLWAILLSVLFAGFVNVVMIRKLNRINMVESLKAVE